MKYISSIFFSLLDYVSSSNITQFKKRIKKNIWAITNKKEVLKSKHQFCDKINTNLKTTSWKNYLFLDNYTFENDVSEMYFKYNCNVINSNENYIYDINDLYKNEKINTYLHMQDISDIFHIESLSYKSKKNSANEIENFINNLNKEFVLEKLKKIYLNFNTLMNQVNKHCYIRYLLIIITDDLFLFLEHTYDYVCPKNNYIKKLVSDYKVLDDDKKLGFFIYVVQEILNNKVCLIETKTSNKSAFLASYLSDYYHFVESTSYIDNKIYKNFKKLKRFLDYEQITYYDILRFCIDCMHNATDINLYVYCILGLSNFFLENLKSPKLKILYVCILLHVYVYERTHYIVDFSKRLLKILMRSTEVMNQKFYRNIIDVLSVEETNIVPILYLSLNSTEIIKALKYYESVKKDKILFKFYYDLIEIVNFTKCIMYGIALNKFN